MKSILLLWLWWVSCAEQELRVHAIDVEGGMATLYVSPSGLSMLVDAGYAGYKNRDAERIVAAAKAAGVTQIDYLLITTTTPITRAACRNWRRKLPSALSWITDRTSRP